MGIYPCADCFPAYVTMSGLAGLSGGFHWKDRYYD